MSISRATTKCRLARRFAKLSKYAGGVRGGKAVKGFFPGGSSTPMLTPDYLDTPMDFESITAAGSLLGTAALIVFDEDTDIVQVTQAIAAILQA